MSMLLRGAVWYLCLLIMLTTPTAEGDPAPAALPLLPEPWPAAPPLPVTSPPPAAPPSREWMLVAAIATGYQPDWDCAVDAAGMPTHRTSTRISTDAHPYGIAADPSLLPYGTSVKVPEYLGLRFPDQAWPVDDTGSAMRHDAHIQGIVHLDLRYKTIGSALKRGKIWLDVSVDVTDWSDAQKARLRRAAQLGERMRRRGVMP